MANGHGDKGTKTLSIIFDTQIPDPQTKIENWEKHCRDRFGAEAKAVVDAMCAHAPQGLVDFIFVELAKRKASIFHVADNRAILESAIKSLLAGVDNSEPEKFPGHHAAWLQQVAIPRAKAALEGRDI